MIILGIVGRAGSGRNTLAQYLREWCAFPIVSMENFARKMAAEMDLAPTQSNLYDVYRQAFEREGRDTFVNRAIQTIQDNGWETAVILGIHQPLEIDVLQDYYRDDWTLIHVSTSDPRERYARLQKQDRQVVPPTYEAFLDEEKIGAELFELDAAIARADLEIQNDGRLEDFHLAIQERIIDEELADEVICG